MTTIASHYTPAEQADIFDSWTRALAESNPALLNELAQGLVDNQETTAERRLTFDPPVEDMGRFVAHKIGWIALAVGSVAATQTSVGMTVNSIRHGNVEVPYVQFAKEAAVVLGAIAIFKYGIKAADRWWNKDNT